MIKPYSSSITVSKTVWMFLGNCKNALHAIRVVLNIFNEQLSTGLTILFIKFIVIKNDFIMMKFQEKLLSTATIKNLIRVGFYIFDNFEMLINYFPVIKIAF